MSIDDTNTKQESSGLLRRMFKRVSNPKQANNLHDSDYLSSEKKTQMLISKQHNDLARRQEFAELRELHVQRMLKESGNETQMPGSEMSKANSHQAETLNKINQLESQMASRWSRQQNANNQDTVLGAAVKQRRLSRAMTGPIVSNVDQSDLSELADPALEEVGVLFASNEDEQVELTLEAMLDKESVYRSHRVTWLTLMDYYRAVGKQGPYEDLAMEYMILFAESAPQWQVFDPALLKKQKVAEASTSGAAAYWSSPAVLDEMAVKSMQDKFDVSDPRIIRVMDWLNLKKITAEGAQLAWSCLKGYDQPEVILQTTGLANIMNYLAAQTKEQTNTDNEVFWRLRLELLRLFGSAEDFDMEAMEYCLAHEVSPPSWVAPECKTEDLDQSTLDDDEAESISLGSNNTTAFTADQGTEFFGLNKAPLRLKGAYKGSMEKELQLLNDKITEDGGYLSINCERMVRIDFSAAGDLLNWIAEKTASGYSVQLVNVHRLLALFFMVMGITVSARVVVRKN